MAERELTPDESLAILKAIAETEEFITVSGHRKFPYKGLGKNVFRITVNIISLDMLINIMEHDQVKNVYFTPAAAGPGQGMDGISMVYRIYVKYHFVQE
jgi:hypothetical protein